MLDCGPVNHHNAAFPGRLEGMRLGRDMQQLRRSILQPAEHIAKTLIYQVGNHEAWIRGCSTRSPASRTPFSIETGLGVKGPKWTLAPQGRSRASASCTSSTATRCDRRRIRAVGGRRLRAVHPLGHFHRAQLHTKISALDSSDVHTGWRLPVVQAGPPLRTLLAEQWMLGFCGYVFPDGSFNDYLTCIVDGRFARTAGFTGDSADVEKAPRARDGGAGAGGDRGALRQRRRQGDGARAALAGKIVINPVRRSSTPSSTNACTRSSPRKRIPTAPSAA